VKPLARARRAAPHRNPPAPLPAQTRRDERAALAESLQDPVSIEDALESGVEFVAEQAAPLGKIDAGAVVQALADAKPDAIFSSLFGADLAKFVREGAQRGLFKDVAVFNLLAGKPEYLDPLKEEAPDGWYVTGYPWSEIKTPEHGKFVAAYQAKYKDYPRLGSVVGYATIKKAGSLDQDKLIAAAKGTTVLTPFGMIEYRPIDHQSTMGAYVGKIGVKDGKGYMKDWRFVDGKDVLPSDADVKKMRPAN
jgi:branched-chain amino acid transport system substrate-binding protein